MSMKVGILTFHFSNNFGALLQAYALRKWLLQIGCDAKFVNYHPAYVEEGRFDLRLTKSGLHTNLKSLFLQFAQARSKWLYPGNLEAIEHFREESLGVSGPRYRNVSELEQANLDFDALVCGSDQIWNVSQQYGLDPVYFLDFKNEASKRISYAASFGSARLPDQYHIEAASLINKLDAVSVREQQGAAFATEITDRSIECVPDPTFLLDDYSDLTQQSHSSVVGDIFFYVLRSADGFHDMETHLRRQMKASVVSGFNPLRRWRAFGTEVLGGPIEWLSALSQSKLVVSNSFHATVFSLLFNVPFIAVRLPGKRAKLSERLEAVLTSVGLSQRLIDAGDIRRASELAETPICWDGVNEAIASQRRVGRDYLQRNLVEQSCGIELQYSHAMH